MSNSLNSQRGVVSILSVIFFILLMSVLTISFLRLMLDEQDQVIDDDLSKAALASAESGVEDAKRALVHCRNLSGAARTTCYQALNNRSCPGMFAPQIESSGVVNPLPTDLGLDTSGPGGAIRVGDPANNQRYTCVVTSLQTDDVVGEANEGLGDFIHLNGVSDYTHITVWWHQTSLDGGAAIPGIGDSQRNYRYDQWRNALGVRFVPMMRLHLVEFERGNTLAQLANKSVGIYAAPTSFGGAPNNEVSIATIDSVAWAGRDKRIEVTCDTPEATSRGYRCGVTLRVPTNSLFDNKDYYLLVKSVYGSPHYMVELDAPGQVPVRFSDVQPEIDSTGAGGDVFRRVISRVSYGSPGFFTTNAIESTTSLCKDFFVTDLDATSACLGL